MCPAEVKQNARSSTVISDNVRDFACAIICWHKSETNTWHDFWIDRAPVIYTHTRAHTLTQHASISSNHNTCVRQNKLHACNGIGIIMALGLISIIQPEPRKRIQSNHNCFRALIRPALLSLLFTPLFAYPFKCFDWMAVVLNAYWPLLCVFLRACVVLCHFTHGWLYVCAWYWCDNQVFAESICLL